MRWALSTFPLHPQAKSSRVSDAPHGLANTLPFLPNGHFFRFGSRSRRVTQAIERLGRFGREIGEVIPDINRAVGPRLDGPGLQRARERGVRGALAFVLIPRDAGKTDCCAAIRRAVQ